MNYNFFFNGTAVEVRRVAAWCHYTNCPSFSLHPRLKGELVKGFKETHKVFPWSHLALPWCFLTTPALQTTLGPTSIYQLLVTTFASPTGVTNLLPMVYGLGVQAGPSWCRVSPAAPGLLSAADPVQALHSILRLGHSLSVTLMKYFKLLRYFFLPPVRRRERNPHS